MEKKTELKEKELEKVTGGAPGGICGLSGSGMDIEELVKTTLGGSNKMSAAGLSADEARKIAVALDDGKDMGSWKTMSGEQFLKWWESNGGKASVDTVGGICGKNDGGIHG